MADLTPKWGNTTSNWRLQEAHYGDMCALMYAVGATTPQTAMSRQHIHTCLGGPLRGYNEFERAGLVKFTHDRTDGTVPGDMSQEWICYLGPRGIALAKKNEVPAPCAAMAAAHNAQKAPPTQYIPESFKSGAGAGFGDHETNKKVEEAAIAFVEAWYVQEKWSVKSVERDGVGFDLLCRKTPNKEHVEVKGVSGTEPSSFVITAGEVRRAKEDVNFVLCIVTCALNQPKMHRYTGVEMLSAFDFAPVQFMARLKNKGGLAMPVAGA